MHPKGEMYKFTKKEIELYQKPCVYFIYVEDEVVYVGVSIRGACRPLYPKHESLQDITGSYEIGALTFETEEDAKAAELVLINSLRPRLNRFIPKPERVVVARKALAGHPSEDPEGAE
jgi:hypothetical protein